MPLCRKCGSTDFEETQANTVLSRVAIRNRLSELDAHIATLTAERQRLRDTADTIVYPVLSLPPEITTEIFLRCIPPQSNLLESPSEAPLLLAQICRQWRQIALDTPHLWQSLFFTDGETCIELLRLWLSRSGSLPLNLDLKCWDASRAGALIETTLLHSHRWQDVKFGLNLRSFSELDLRRASLPMLRSISLRVIQSSWPSDNSVADTVTIEHAPSLRDVHVFTLPQVKIVIPWASITTLTLLQNMPLTECMSLLEECPNLITLHVSTTVPAMPAADFVILDSLETLTCNLGVASVLEHLTVPHLSRLTVSNISEHQHATLYSAFIRRSAFPLQFLAVHEIREISLDTLVLFLRAVPDSVSDVEFGFRGESTEQILSALKLMDVLPQLKILRLQVNSRIHDEEYKDLLDMLHARLKARPPNAPLEWMTLHLNTKLRLSVRMMPRSSRITQLRDLVSAGLKIDFTIRSLEFSTHVVLN
ncbi:hypothetical protein C8R45DRAFT_1216536 [Mycena sanguinolenta]|nr:hypothetical protein C8R45DRAFT_1216536 [Mycena sanguinolenta]